MGRPGLSGTRLVDRRLPLARRASGDDGATDARGGAASCATAAADDAAPRSCSRRRTSGRTISSTRSASGRSAACTHDLRTTGPAGAAPRLRADACAGSCCATTLRATRSRAPTACWSRCRSRAAIGARRSSRKHIESAGLTPLVAHPERSGADSRRARARASSSPSAWPLQLNATCLLGQPRPGDRGARLAAARRGPLRSSAPTATAWTRPARLDEAFELVRASAWGRRPRCRCFDGTALGLGMR